MSTAKKNCLVISPDGWFNDLHTYKVDLDNPAEVKEANRIIDLCVENDPHVEWMWKTEKEILSDAERGYEIPPISDARHDFSEDAV